MRRMNCLFCESTKLVRVMDLGLHPFADTFLKEEDMADGEKVFPLVCDLCEDCGNVQLQCATNPEDRYSNHEYSYTSSNSAFARKHWDEYAAQVSSKVKLGKGLVVEVGSNDGYLTARFHQHGNPAIGVDPSQYVADLAKERGIETVVDLFNTKVAHDILQRKGKAELIVANNVFNHSDTPIDFVKAVASLLDENGTFVYELPYWAVTIQSGKFDQVYHEHVNYLTVVSSEKILSQGGLGVFAVEVVDYHGGSLRVYAKRKDKCGVSSEAEALKAQEREIGLFDIAMYEKFMARLYAKRASFLEQVYAIKKAGGTIIAVGAAAKGNTLLNFYNLDHKTLAFVTDESPHKQGKYTPYTRIPIRGDNTFANYDEVYALILSWNLSEGLKKALLEINPKVKFITPW